MDPGMDPSRIRAIWVILILVLIGILGVSAWKWFKQGTMFRSLPVYGKLPDFEFTERAGNTVGSRKLGGKVWIADFIFTRCAGPCPMMTWNMSQLQTMLQDVDDVRLVTFTVDPEFDTPQVLTEYARRFQAGKDRWFFLTGKTDAIRKLAQENFKLTAVQHISPDENDILHSTHFILVDAKGYIRGYYNSADPEVFSRIVADVRKLLRWQHTLPALNAILNSTSTLLLLSAYRAVRTRRLLLHRNLMFAAIITSAAFLVSYLIYHFGVQLTKRYEGPFRPLYFTILISHTILAITVLPLVLMTTARALRGQKGDPTLTSPELPVHFAKHRAIARWTFPIWLYVSVTGVVVYLMLY